MLPAYLWTKIRAVFFDAEGTLFHIKPSVGEIYAKIWTRYGLSVPKDLVNQRFQEVYQRLKPRGRLSPLQCYETWKLIFLETLKPFGQLRDKEKAFKETYEAFSSRKNFLLSPGVREVLSLLRDSGRKIGLISNWDERVRRLLQDFDLEDYFETIIISCEVGVPKPEKEIFLYACQELGIKPQETLMIGDDLEGDVLGARRAGLWALRYPGGNLEQLFPR